ncbi:MAG: PP2C family protein-serine/threonine phosphatase [Planctomycetota bacterium]
MYSKDTTTRPTIALLREILEQLSRETEPAGAVARFGRRFRDFRPVDSFLSVSRRGLGPGEYKITRRFTPETVSEAPDGDLPNPWRDWDSLPTHTGGFIGDVLEVDEPQLFQELDVRDDPVLGNTLADLGSCTVVPVYDNGESLNWAFRFMRDPYGYDLEDLENDLLTINLFGGITRNLVTLKRERELNERLNQQLMQIASIQRSLLPERLPKIPGLGLATSYLTSDEAGGDYYDFFPFPCGSWGILIADVSGHGPAAATVMAMLRAILHCYPGEDFSPDSVMQFANERLSQSNLDGSFVTAFFAIYDPRKATLTFSRCGHNPPRVYRASTGKVESLEGDGTPPLGILPDIPARAAAMKLDPGDAVILYTDGITEAFDSGDEMFGVPRMDMAIERAGAEHGANPDAMVEAIHADLYAHTGSFTRDDDQTLVVLAHNGERAEGCGP